MSRRAQAPTRTVLPDPKFGSEMLAKFMNMIMERGKKSVAETIVYGAIDRIAERTSRPADQALQVLQTALDNVKPAVEVKSRRVGGATYQVPVEVAPRRARTLVEAFMRGLNRTAPLKFDHPGLGTTATESGADVLIQELEDFTPPARRVEARALAAELYDA